MIRDKIGPDVAMRLAYDEELIRAEQ